MRRQVQALNKASIAMTLNNGNKRRPIPNQSVASASINDKHNKATARISAIVRSVACCGRTLKKVEGNIRRLYRLMPVAKSIRSKCDNLPQKIHVKMAILF